MAGEGTLYQRKSGDKWYLIVSTGERKPNGQYKQKWIDLETTDKNEAKKRRIEKLAEFNKTGKVLEPSKQTYGEWLDFWLEEIKKPDLKSTAYDDYECQIRVHIKPKLGQIELRKLTSETLQKFYNEKRKDTKLGFDKNGNRIPTDKQLSARTIQKIQMIIRASLHKAYRLKKILENPDMDIDRIKYKSPPAKFLDPDEVPIFLEKVKKDRWVKTTFYSLIITTLGSGLRVGEVCTLKWDDINFKEWKIRVDETVERVKTHSETGPKQKLIWQEPKTERSNRVIPVPLDVIVSLRLLRWHQKKEKQNAAEFYTDENYVFAHPDGSIYNPKKVTDQFIHLTNRIGYPGITIHKLRHSYATMLLEKGEDTRTISDNLGHATNRVTEIYAHVIEKMKRRAAQRIEGFSKRKTS
jgi:integrase